MKRCTVEELLVARAFPVFYGLPPVFFLAQELVSFLTLPQYKPKYANLKSLNRRQA